MPTFQFPPQCASRFEPDRLLGEGGFGSVWLAHQKGLDRPIAVKFIRTDLVVDPEQIERFKNEARVTANLQHPSIVRVIDHDVEDGVPWIAYEYLPGRSLADILAAGPLSWTEALKVGQQIASALEEAHAKGVIHRDIKPENVLEVEPGRYKLADFGIAKWTAASHIKTRTGFMMGTPTHVPPEQIRGEPPSPRGDVYALGVMMYQMLTGQLPFADESILGLLRAHLEERLTTPSKLQAGLPPAVDELVKRAMNKAPGERFADGAEMRRAIEEISARPAANDQLARPAVDGPAMQSGSTSRTRVPRASGRTRPVARVEVPPAPPSSHHRGLYAVASAVLCAGLAVFAALRPQPVVPPPPSPSPAPTASARARITAPEIAALLEPVHEGYFAFDRIANQKERDPLLGSRLPFDVTEATPLVERGLTRVLEVLRHMQDDAFEGPAWVEELALATDQVLQRMQRINSEDRSARMNALAAALDQAAGRTSNDPWRRALAYTVHARQLQLKSGMDASAAVEQFNTALKVLERETPREWPVSLRGLKARLTLAYQAASSAERADQLNMLSANEKVPAAVVAAWDQGLAMMPDVHALFAKAEEFSLGADDYWDLNWQVLRTADKVLKLKGFPKAMRDRATLELGRTVSRVLRIRIPAGLAADRDRRLRQIAHGLVEKQVTVRLDDGSVWPK